MKKLYRHKCEVEPIIRQYAQDGLTDEEIAKKLFYSVSTVQQYRIRYGIKGNRCVRKNKGE